MQLQLSPLRVGLVAVIGLILGSFLVTPLFANLLQMRDVGLLLGSTLGAFLSVWFAVKISESAQVKNLVNNFLALSATGEVLALMLQANPFSDLWKRLGNQTEKKFAARFGLEQAKKIAADQKLLAFIFQNLLNDKKLTETEAKINEHIAEQILAALTGSKAALEGEIKAIIQAELDALQAMNGL